MTGQTNTAENFSANDVVEMLTCLRLLSLTSHGLYELFDTKKTL